MDSARGFGPLIEAVPVKLSVSLDRFADGDASLLVGLMRRWPTSVASADG